MVSPRSSIPTSEATSYGFIKVLKNAAVEISMDAKDDGGITPMWNDSGEL